MRGYFAVGVDRISKPGNVGNLVRTAHAFGAQFFFAVQPRVNLKDLRQSDTSFSDIHMPIYTYDSAADMKLPDKCELVGVELIDDAIELPSFRHPLRAAYIMGPERGNLSPELVQRCDHIVQIPTKFCVNVGIAGAMVIYDRMVSLGRFAERPVRAGGKPIPLPEHVHGEQKIRTKN